MIDITFISKYIDREHIGQHQSSFDHLRMDRVHVGIDRHANCSIFDCCNLIVVARMHAARPIYNEIS
jgi:polysaccharide pyruvyl transferase WcaK-like protein